MMSRTQSDAADWKFQLRDALWLQPSAPFRPRSMAREMLSYFSAVSLAAALVLIVAGFMADAQATLIVLAVISLAAGSLFRLLSHATRVRLRNAQSEYGKPDDVSSLMELRQSGLPKKPTAKG